MDDIANDICVELMDPSLDMGYNLYTDNWYTVVPLAEFLSSRNTNITGMVHTNQKPAGVKQKLPKGDFCIGWHDKKHASYTSKYRRLVKNDNIYRQTKSRTPCQDQ